MDEVRSRVLEVWTMFVHGSEGCGRGLFTGLGVWTMFVHGS